MSANPSTQWGALVIDTLATAGVDTVVISPGSRSTPLVVAAHEHPAIETVSIIDERSASYFAVGRAKRTRDPVALVCTSGTAGANMHPAVIEADRSRTPLIVCTADRPADLQTVGANQTIDQRDLFGDAVRWAPVLPAARDESRSMDAVRVTTSQAVHRSTHPHPGPVHLNVRFRKPLSPAEPTGHDVDQSDQLTSVASTPGRVSPAVSAVESVRERLERADRPLIVAGPLPVGAANPVRTFAGHNDIPLLADPLSGIRFGGDVDAPVLGGFDAFLDTAVTTEWPRPDFVLRFGARPTSVAVRAYLEPMSTDDVLVDPVGAYRDPGFSATEIIAASPGPMIAELGASALSLNPDPEWSERLMETERRYWEFVTGNQSDLPPEGRIAFRTITDAPPGATVFVSNSMPIRDVDRFGRPTDRPLTVLGNRGASGIDGIPSSALGAASATDDPAILLTGDLACYHDMNGLLTITRSDVDVTIVVINNDGGGIFNKLPIAEVEPPFTDHFRTPHGIDFSSVAALYDLPYIGTTPTEFGDVYPDQCRSDTSCLIEVTVDGAANHQARDSFQQSVRERLTDAV